MQQFRSFVKGPVGVVLLVLFTIPFIITGFYGYFTGSPAGGGAVAEVNGVEIRAQELDRQVQLMRQQLRQQSPTVDPSIIDSFIQPSTVLSGLVNNQLLLSEAEDSNMRVSVEQAGRLVVKAPQFQQDGQYSREVFQQFVRARGMTEAGFINALRSDLVMNQVRAGIAETEFALPHELAEQRRLAEQQRDMRYAIKRATDMASSYQVSDEEIQQYYDERIDDFMRPEQFRLGYVELDRNSVDVDTSVSDEDIAREFEARRAAMETVAAASERRRMAHIQLSLDEEQAAESLAADIRARLDGGEDFAALAEELSQDASSANKGGELGTFTRDELPEAMAQVLFSMQEGQVSEPVQVDGNLHLIKLMEVTKRELPTLAEMKASIKADLLRGRIDAQIAEKAAQLDELAFEHSDLVVPAEETGLEVKTTDWFSLSAPVGIAENPKVLEALNSSAVRKDGHNSELLELGPNRFAVVRLAEVRAAEPRPLDDVRSVIADAVRLQRATRELEALAAAASEQIEQGAGFASAAQALQAQPETASSVTRDSDAPSSELISELFSMPRPQEGEAPMRVLRLANGDVAVIELQAVRDGAGAELNEQQLSMALAELASVEGERSLRQAIAYMHERGDVSINQERVQALANPAASVE